jgi:hypothetical protein
VARFSAWGVSQEAIEHEAWEDLLHEKQRAAASPEPSNLTRPI